MTLHHVAQRSAAWHQLRAGRLTGSRAKHILAPGRGKEEAVGRRDLRYQLAAERLTNQPQEDDYINAAMQWGLDHEAAAVAAYEVATGAMVEPIGFIAHDELLAGTSPDGFVGRDGAVSIKCPKTATHCGYLRSDLEPGDHAAQHTHELWLTGRAWIDLVSYDPRLPSELQLWMLRVTRTAEELAAYDQAARLFLAQVDQEVEALQALRARRAA
jgi:hypothetical protein